MKRPTLSFARAALVAAALAPLAPPAAALNLGTEPLYLGASIPPIVMLIAPKDHQLFKKAYDDFSDLDSSLPGGDALLEITYKHSVDYYGYFDPFKCYSYVNAGTANARFIPFGTTADKKCTGGNAGKWAGNFLNWATMSRLDVMRKLLYGGFRLVDAASGTPLTVLARATIPVEGHAWAKHYRGEGGATIAEVTPFTTALSTPRTYTSTSNRTIPATVGGTLTFRVDNPNTQVHPLVNGDQVTISRNSSNFMTGRVTTQAFGTGVDVTFTIDAVVGSGTHNSWTITNHSSQGITICNTTQDTANASHTTTNLPLMRVAAGDYTLWAVGERQVCRWSDEPPAALNANQMAQSELEANSGGPLRGVTPSMTLNSFSVTNGDYVVHVLACDPALVGTERCTQYPNGNIKPTGLLHDYAASSNKKIKFGLLTGSYMKNKSGGVLRRTAGFLDSSTSAAPSFFDSAVDEINADTGVFNTAVRGIISTFNRIKLYGFGFSSGLYDSGDSCGNPAVVNFTDGNCASWGNPLAEMYVEALRYFAGKSASSAFTYTEAAGQKDFDLGLRQATWASPISSSNYCTPLNLIVMNASVNSYDRDQVPTDLFPTGVTATTLTNAVGGLEGINGGSFLVGRVSGTPATSDICTPKTIANFGDASGVCPEAPALGGSYLIAGAAHWARTNRIRSDLTVPASDTRALKVTTYGIALASGAPKIEIPVPGSNPQRFVTILPASQSWNSGDGAGNSRGGGAIVDFKVIRQDQALGTGKFFVSWENAQQGSDYDLDVWGTIEYRFQNSNTQIVVTTNTFFGAAGTSTLFGYVISGTAGQDGVHFHSGFKGTSNTVISYNYPTGYSTATTGNNECNDCRHTDAPTSRTYNVSAAPAATVLREPLYYATKYGGFSDQNGNNRPDLAPEWDSRNNLTGADGTDGNPDTYFPVTNPGALEAALDRAFIAVLQVSSASSVATNSTSLQSGSIVYQARFNANEWSGQLLAFSISTTGAIDPTPLWDAGQLLPAPSSRQIITYKPDPTNQARGATPKGVPFRFDSLNSLQQADLNKNAVGTADPAGTDCTGVTSTSFTPAGCTKQGRIRLDWLRGSQVNEGATASKYRVRPTTRLGDIVNSTPIYVGPPTSAQYGDFTPPAAAYTSDPTFEAFRNTAGIIDRTPIIYAAGNDGMLHGFDASTGAQKGVEKIAYVPSTTYRNLTRLTDKTYSHRYFVDGSPTVADVKFDDGSWHTLLVGGLNAGGQGIYALDITNPNNFAESRANDLVLWEFTDFNDAQLGNTYSQPSIAKMRNGKFAVIFGNGYNNSIATPPADSGATVSLSGCGALFILFVEGGIDGTWDAGDYRTINVPISCSAANPNGLATPRVLDVDNDGIADYIYAGDLRGNMWKFDVRSADPNVWALSNGTTPLFVATDSLGTPQPITSAAVTFAATANAAGTTMILFGTGKYLEQIDNVGPYQYQSFYGLWDKHDGSTISGRSELLQQKVLGATVANPLGTTADNVATTGVDESGFRITTPYKPNYTGSVRVNTQFGETNPQALDELATTPAGQRGWFMDFPYSGDPAVGTGERVVFRPVITTGKLVFTTLVPSSANCEFGGTSFLMDLDPLTGARLGTSPFDVNNDTNFNSADLISTPWGNVAVSGRASTIGIVPTPTVIAMPPNEVKVLSGSSGALITVRERGEDPPPGAGAGRRIMWRQLFTD